MTSQKGEHVRSSADEQLVDQARKLHAEVMRSGDLATEGMWTARAGYYDPPPNNYVYVGAVRTPKLASAKPYGVFKAYTQDPAVAGLLTFASTALPQLCDLADRALAMAGALTPETIERLAYEASVWAKDPAHNIGADQPSLVFARRFAFLLAAKGAR